MTGLWVLLRFGSSYLCLSGARLKIWSYMESLDNHENALIKQGRIEGDSQAIMGTQEGLS